jgi:hypothetical protein
MVEIEGVTRSTVDIRAERVAYATTDSAASDLPSRIVIKEEVTPTRISRESERINSFLSGVGYEAHYHVRVPKETVVRAATTGAIRIGVQ